MKILLSMLFSFLMVSNVLAQNGLPPLPYSTQSNNFQFSCDNAQLTWNCRKKCNPSERFIEHNAHTMITLEDGTHDCVARLDIEQNSIFRTVQKRCPVLASNKQIRHWLKSRDNAVAKMRSDRLDTLTILEWLYNAYSQRWNLWFDNNCLNIR